MVAGVADHVWSLEEIAGCLTKGVRRASGMKGHSMLFFIDESWQNIGGQEIGALGGVGIPEPVYNHFCREVFAFKRDILGAEQLKDRELRGTSCFAKSAFSEAGGVGAFLSLAGC